MASGNVNERERRDPLSNVGFKPLHWPSDQGLSRERGGRVLVDGGSDGKTRWGVVKLTPDAPLSFVPQSDDFQPPFRNLAQYQRNDSEDDKRMTSQWMGGRTSQGIGEASKMQEPPGDWDNLANPD
jgi:hypothetical protein